MAKMKSTAAKIGDAISDAASTVAKAAEAHVVKPVGKALGLIDAEPAKEKKPAAKPAAEKKRGPMTAAAKVMTKTVSKTAAPPESKKNAVKGPASRGRGKPG